MRTVSRGVRMRLPAGWAREIRPLLVLALPLILSRLGAVLMSVVDVLSAGTLGPWAVASLGLASTTVFVVAILPLGLLLGLDPLTSQAVGADEPDRAKTHLASARWLALGLTPILAVLHLVAADVLMWAGQPADLIAPTQSYLVICIAGIAPMLGFHVLSTWLAAHGHTAFLIRITLTANALNLALNLLLVRGWFGLPSLGVEGLAIATVACQWFQVLSAYRLLRPGGRFERLGAPWRAADRTSMRAVVHLGLPIGLQYLVESSGFAFTTFLIGALVPEALAGHQVALHIAALFFMVALGISGAAAVRVGHAWGAGDRAGVRRVAAAAWLSGAALAAFAAAALFFGRFQIARWYLGDDPSAAIAASLLCVAAAFHIADSVQGIGFGVLRGVGDTKVPVLFNAVGYYVLGIPVGLLLLHRGGGAPGLWWGLTVALVAVASLLLGRFILRMRDHEAAPPWLSGGR